MRCIGAVWRRTESHFPHSFQRLDPRKVSLRVCPQMAVFVEGRHPLGYIRGTIFLTNPASRVSSAIRYGIAMDGYVVGPNENVITLFVLIAAAIVPETCAIAICAITRPEFT